MIKSCQIGDFVVSVLFGSDPDGQLIIDVATPQLVLAGASAAYTMAVGANMPTKAETAITSICIFCFIFILPIKYDNLALPASLYYVK